MSVTQRHKVSRGTIVGQMRDSFSGLSCISNGLVKLSRSVTHDREKTGKKTGTVGQARDSAGVAVVDKSGQAEKEE